MSLLHERGFRLLIAGQLLVILAVWGLRVLLLIWVYQLTHSGTAVSLVGLAEAVPLLLLAPVTGVLIDRWHRAYTMAGAALACAILSLPLLLVNGRADLWLIIAIAVAANTAVQLCMNAATAAMPVVVGTDRVGQANSIVSLLNGGIAVLAPVGASLLIATAGPHGAVAVLATLFLLAVPLLLLVPAPRAVREPHESQSFGREMLSGLHYVQRSSLLVALTVLVFLFMLGFGALSVLDVVFVNRALHLSADTVGVLFGASGMGELVGGVVMASTGRWAASRYHLLLGGAILVCGCCFIVYSAAPVLPIAAGALVVAGFMYPPAIVSFTTMMQYVTEDAFMGRVGSVINTALAAALILSMAVGGTLSDLFGVRQVIAAAAVILIGSGCMSLVLIRSTPQPRSTVQPTSGSAEAASG